MDDDAVINVTVVQSSKATVFRLAGKLTYETEDAFKRLITIDPSSTQPYIILQCRKLTEIDSTGLGALVSLTREAGALKNAGRYTKPVKLCNVPPHLGKLLQITRLNRVFDIFPTEQAAQESISNKLIVLIDESRDAVQLMSAFLGLQGHDLHIVENESQLQRYLLDASPDLIVIDPVMHAADGWKMLKTLCKSWDVPIIVTSSVPMEGRKTAPEIRHWFQKPYDVVKFLEAVKHTLDTPPANGLLQGPRPLDVLGVNIKKRRSQLGLSQEALSQLTKMDRTYISKVESGLVNLSIKSLLTLAKALDTTGASLLVNVQNTW